MKYSEIRHESRNHTRKILWKEIHTRLVEVWRIRSDLIIIQILNKGNVLFVEKICEFVDNPKLFAEPNGKNLHIIKKGNRAVTLSEITAERIVKIMQKLPYYMVYPMPFVYDDERIEERDMEYMKSLYPDAAKRILPYIEEECDRLEYQCSMIYDEYPDRLQLQLMCKRICDNVKKHEKFWMECEYPELLSSQSEMKFEQTKTREHAAENTEKIQGQERPLRPVRQDWLQNLVEVMLYQELLRRRREGRRRGRRIY